VRRPVARGIEKRVSRHIAQEVCPWNSPKLVQVSGEEGYRARPIGEASLAERPLRCQDPRWEPGAVVPHAGFCAGGPG
jgi:hypothetical protein